MECVVFHLFVQARTSYKKKNIAKINRRTRERDYIIRMKDLNLKSSRFNVKHSLLQLTTSRLEGDNNKTYYVCLSDIPLKTISNFYRKRRPLPMTRDKKEHLLTKRAQRGSVIFNNLGQQKTRSR